MMSNVNCPTTLVCARLHSLEPWVPNLTARGHLETSTPNSPPQQVASKQHCNAEHTWRGRGLSK